MIVGDPKFQIELDTPEAKEVNSKGEKLTYPDDWIVDSRTLDFSDLFTTDPNLLKIGVGLQPEAFADFHFNHKNPPHVPGKWICRNGGMPKYLAILT